jgi:hypothetical protein
MAKSRSRLFADLIGVSNIFDENRTNVRAAAVVDQGTGQTLRATTANTMSVANTQALVNARLGATATVALTGDVTASATAFSANTLSISTDIASTGTPTGTFGSGSLVPVITVGADGRITNISNTTVAGVSSTSWTVANNNLRIATADGSTFDTTIGSFMSVANTQTLHSSITANLNSYVANTNSKINQIESNLLSTNTSIRSAISTEVSNLVDSAPSTLNTLNELAAALGDDANFATTTATNIGQKLGATASITLTGAITGSGSFSSNAVSITTSSGTGINAATLDSLDSTQFLRSDTADTKTSGALVFSDNVPLHFGTGSDLRLYHSGTASYIQDYGTGNLFIQANDLRLQDDVGGHYIQGNKGSDVKIYYPADGTVHLATTAAGVDVTGNITVSGTVDGRDVASDGSKLDGIESGATADQSASEILTLIKTVDGSGSGLDADTLDGQQGSYYRQAWEDIDTGTRTNYNLDFKAPTGGYSGFRFSKSTSGDGAADAGFFLIRGTSDSDVYTAEGITLVADAGWLTLAQRTTGSRGVRIMSGTTSTERLKVNTDGTIQFVNGAGFTYNGNTIWHAGNDGSGSGLDADTLDGVQGNKYFTSYNNAGTTGWEDSNRNFRINSGGNAVGFAMHESDGTFGFQLYGDGTSYGFLQDNWGSWDLKKNINGQLQIRVSGTDYTVWHAGNDGSGSGLDADLLDGISSGSFLRSDADDTATGYIDFSTGLRAGEIAVGGTDSSTSSYNVTIKTINSSSLYLQYDNGNDVVIGSSGTNADLVVEGNITVSGQINSTGNLSLQSGSMVIGDSGGYEGIYFEDDKHAITWNDGNGNFNIRVGNNGITDENCTEAGYIFHDEWSQSAGWRQFNISSASLSVGASPTWRPQMEYNYNSVYLRYQGSTKLETTSTGISVTGDVTSSSDERLKENIEVIPNALEKVSQLKGVTFNWKDDEDKRESTGVIAQDVQKVLPSAVKETDEGMLTVAYGNMIGLLVESIKELKAEIEELKKS